MSISLREPITLRRRFSCYSFVTGCCYSHACPHLFTGMLCMSGSSEACALPSSITLVSRRISFCTFFLQASPLSVPSTFYRSSSVYLGVLATDCTGMLRVDFGSSLVICRLSASCESPAVQLSSPRSVRINPPSGAPIKLVSESRAEFPSELSTHQIPADCVVHDRPRVPTCQREFRPPVNGSSESARS